MRKKQQLLDEVDQLALNMSELKVKSMATKEEDETEATEYAKQLSNSSPEAKQMIQPVLPFNQ